MAAVMGRPRETHKHMPPGMRLVDGRWHWRPTNRAAHELCARLWPGQKSVAAGDQNNTNDGARQWWAETISPALREAEQLPELPKEGTVAEIIARYRREFEIKAKSDRARYCDEMLAAFGHHRYAKNETEASTGKYLRAMNITSYLNTESTRKVYDKRGNLREDGRPVAANRAVELLSRIFRMAKTRWGYCEYNPCLHVEYNPEPPREDYQDDDAFMRVHEKASPKMKCAMDLAQMNGARRGMILRLTLADVDQRKPYVRFTVNKRRKGAKPKYKLAPWTDDLRAVVDRALEIRSKVRGGQRVDPATANVADLDTAPLFLTRKGKAWGPSAFNTEWQRVRRASGFGKHEFHFHDIKAKALSDSPDLANAQERGDHVDARITKQIYRRKPAVVTPLDSVSRKRKA